MAKKLHTPKTVQGELGDWNDVPKPVRDAADHYREKLNEAGEARGSANSAKERLIELMVKHDVKRAKLEDGKVVELSDEKKVKIRKASDPVTVGGDGEDEEADD